jgi:Tfp pilus assembly protein PilO
MASIRRIVGDFRGALIALALLVIVGIGGLFLGVYPLRRRVAAAEAAALRAANQLRVARHDEVSAQRLVAGTAQAATDLDRFYAQILPAGRTAARKLAYLQVAEMAEGNGLSVERRSITVEQRKSSQLSQLTMRMVLQGRYDDVRRFLRDLETSPAFVVISGIELVQRETGAADLSLHLDLETYFRGPNGE